VKIGDYSFWGANVVLPNVNRSIISSY
jgi:hypothetical protein